MRTDEELRAAIGELFWWHKMELRPGIVTPGRANVDYLLPLYGIPEDLTGKTVLDIGCWDGFYAFECERRGAAKVLATDLWEAAGQDAFLLAHKELGSKIGWMKADVYDLSMMLHPGERYDVTLFLGVLYHLKHPLLALQEVADCTAPGGLVIVDTVVSHPAYDQPVMAFCPGRELSDDPTNWWAPNPACMAAMLEEAGFTNVTSPVPDYYGNRAVFHATKKQDMEIAAQNARETRERRKHQEDRRGRTAAAPAE